MEDCPHEPLSRAFITAFENAPVSGPANQAILKCSISGFPLTADNVVAFVGDFLDPENPNLQELIREGESGLSYEPGDKDALVVLGHGLVAQERERGTLRQLLLQGASRRSILGGKLAALLVVAAVFQLANPIGFDAPDELPVQLMIFLLVPEAATQKHLEILSEIAELLSDSALREKMKQATDAGELHAQITGWQSAHAAA